MGTGWVRLAKYFLVLAGLVLLNTLPILCFKEPTRFKTSQHVTDQSVFSWSKSQRLSVLFSSNPSSVFMVDGTDDL